MTGLAALLAIMANGMAHADGFQYRAGASGLRVTAASATPPAPTAPSAPVISEEAVGVLSADTSADFGSVTLNATANRRFTFTNTGNLAATGVFASIPQTTGLTIAANSCGTVAAPVSVPKQSSCSIVLTYGGATPSSLIGASLSVSGVFRGAVQSIPLSGTTGNFNATATWSSTFSTGGTALVATDLMFGTQTTGTVNYRTFYLPNTGTNGAIAAGFTLSGGSGNFKIVTLRPNSKGSTNTGTCTGGASTIAADGQSVSVCAAGDIAGGSYPYLKLMLAYTPGSVGNHAVTLTPVTNNGTILPGAITLTGRGEFNPTGAWSSTYSASGTALVAGDLDFGTKTTNTVNTRTLYLRNTGTNGAMAAGFTLSGDTGGNFKIVNLRPNSIGSTNTGTCTGSIAAVAADGRSVGICAAEDIAGDNYPYLKLTYTYTPATVGNHSVTLTPVTNNGTVLPGALTLNGRGEFNPTAVWSSSASSLVAVTDMDRSYGAKAVNSTNYKYLYLRNTGTNGALAVGFTLSGDTSQFRLWSIKPGTSTNGTSCQSGAVAADGLSATPCVAQDIAGGSYPHVMVMVRYLPTGAGNHSITLTPYTTNGAPAPTPMTLTGTGQ